ncbi:PilZ domain-containing protein [Sphingobium sp. CCH11-B1]|jgi:hypothetical protein|uniref:PilZ domain-containing protein n=1 Tax=Sphingobium sp. CCH11-B1 TaxID=1768781 RepID=UPI00082F8A95|nr:PilZ domain-containing protein [Sphingobium sp. CCH11-B1]MEA3390401.1 PilZ domain-containing protein [Pseudomonadota bacterium]
MKKREPRVLTSIPARMRLEDQWLDVKIMNLSLHGMMLRMARAPSRGSYIEVRRASSVIVGRVVWSKDGQCGVRAQDEIDMATLANAPVQVAAPVWKAGDADRRADRRRYVDQSEERSRLVARRLQFAALTLFVLLASAAILKIISDSFVQAIARVADAL